jgi:arginase
MPVRIVDATRDPATGIIGYASVERLTRVVRTQIGKIIKAGEIPVVQGGCCSMVMGAVAGAKDSYDSVAVVYIDGHMDLYTGETSPEGLCADMPSAILLGYGPLQLADAMGKQALLAPEELFLLAYRDEELAQADGSLMPADFRGRLKHCNVHDLRDRGVENVAEETLTYLQRTRKKFWLHIDWDVMDENVLPSADYLMPNGLTWTEFETLVRPFVQAEELVGVTMSDYNPDNDPSLIDGQKIVEMVERLFIREKFK